MQELTDEKKSAEACMAEQRAFFSDVSKAIRAAAMINEVDNRLSAEIREIKQDQKDFQETLKPVLEAYKKGLTLKSKLGTLAIGYIFAMFLFPQLSPSSVLSVLKLLL